MRITLRVRAPGRPASWAIPILVSLALLAVSFGAQAVPRGERTAAAAPLSLPAPIVSEGPGRNVYLTNTEYSTASASTACGPGYHMASLWEIVGVSNFEYVNAHPAAYNKADSGDGPPAGWWGWVRTGSDSSGSTVAGIGNCLNWSTTDSASSGTAVRLTNNWSAAPGAVAPWQVQAFACNYIGPVWCAGNFSYVYLPFAVR